MQTTILETEPGKITDARYDEKTLRGFRERVLDLSVQIVSGYQIVEPGIAVSQGQLPLYEQLAYLRAVNTINIDRLLSVIESDETRDKIDVLSDEARRTHKRGRYVYWKAIRKVQEYGFGRLRVEDVDISDVQKLLENYKVSREKISEIEQEVSCAANSPFPRIIKVGTVNPIRIFQEIINKHRRDVVEDQSRICEVAELGYRGAYDTLALKRCFDAMKRKASFSVESAICDEAKDAHQWRGWTFWMSLHKVDQLSYDRARKNGSSEEVLVRLEKNVNESTEKIEKLERRHLNMQFYRMNARDIEITPPIYLSREPQGIVEL